MENILWSFGIGILRPLTQCILRPFVNLVVIWYILSPKIWQPCPSHRWRCCSADTSANHLWRRTHCNWDEPNRIFFQIEKKWRGWFRANSKTLFAFPLTHKMRTNELTIIRASFAISAEPKRLRTWKSFLFSNTLITFNIQTTNFLIFRKKFASRKYINYLSNF
jgi:hypothetical protein